MTSQIAWLAVGYDWRAAILAGNRPPLPKWVENVD